MPEVPDGDRPAANSKTSASRPRPAPRPRLFTTEEVAALTGRQPVTVKLRSLRAQREGWEFGQKIGRQWLYTEQEIRDLAAIPPQRGRPDKEKLEARREKLAAVALEDLAAAAVDLDDAGGEISRAS